MLSLQRVLATQWGMHLVDFHILWIKNNFKVIQDNSISYGYYKKLVKIRAKADLSLTELTYKKNE